MDNLLMISILQERTKIEVSDENCQAWMVSNSQHLATRQYLENA